MSVVCVYQYENDSLYFCVVLGACTGIVCDHLINSVADSDAKNSSDSHYDEEDDDLLNSVTEMANNMLLGSGYDITNEYY